MLPSWTWSSTPVTVTVCATFQFAVVKVSDAGATVPSVRSFDDNPIVTFAVGWLVRTIVNVAVPPASVGVRPDVGFTVIPATSLSVFVTDTSDAYSGCVSGRGLVLVAVMMMLLIMVSFATLSKPFALIGFAA